jgi:hypothetical protein
VCILNKPIEIKFTQHFNFEQYGVTNEEDKEKFLRQMCNTSIDKPIVQDNIAIGVITKSNIDGNKDSIIYDGLLFKNAEIELFKNDNDYSVFGFSLNKVDKYNKEIYIIECENWGSDYYE